jgi:hypothetical protein
MEIFWTLYSLKMNDYFNNTISSYQETETCCLGYSLVPLILSTHRDDIKHAFVEMSRFAIVMSFAIEYII